MNKQQEYDKMQKDELISLCLKQDYLIDKYIQSLKCCQSHMLCKNDIMDIYHCESNKALRILKLMFQMGYGNKIGKEYYISKEAQEEFVRNMAGKEVFI